MKLSRTRPRRPILRRPKREVHNRPPVTIEMPGHLDWLFGTRRDLPAVFHDFLAPRAEISVTRCLNRPRA
jgi:hypothetical protein